MLLGGPAKQDDLEAELRVLFPRRCSSFPGVAAYPPLRTPWNSAVLWGCISEGNVSCHLAGGVRRRGWRSGKWVGWERVGEMGTGTERVWKGICVSVEAEWGVRPVRTGTGRNICEGKKKTNRRPRVRRNKINCTCEGGGKRYKLKEEVWKGKEIK